MNTDTDVDIQNRPTIYGLGPRLGGMTTPAPLDPLLPVWCIKSIVWTVKSGSAVAR